MADPPAITVVELGETVSGLGGRSMVTVAEAVLVPEVAVRVAVAVAERDAGGA
jgi:hypothetical protein